MNKILNKTLEQVARDHLRKLYNQCTEAQQQLFNRMYKSVDEIPFGKIDWACTQCERTIANNKKKENPCQ